MPELFLRGILSFRAIEVLMFVAQGSRDVDVTGKVGKLGLISRLIRNLQGYTVGVVGVAFAYEELQTPL